MDKTVAAVVQDALDRGWIVRTTAKGHLFMKHPGGGQIVVPSKAGSPRNIRNIRADLRRIEGKAEMSTAAVEEPEEPVVEELAEARDHGEWEPHVTPGGFGFDRRLRMVEQDGGGIEKWEYRCQMCLRHGFFSYQACSGHMRTHGWQKSPLGLVRDPRPEPERVGVSELARAVADLVDRQVGDMHRENNRLRAENKRLREALKTLAQLAEESGEV